MGRPSHEPPLTTTLVPAVLRWAGKPVDGDEVRLSLTAIEAALDNLAAERGEPELGLLLPDRLASTRYGYGELAARASASVAAGLDKLARYTPMVVPGADAVFDGHTFRVTFPPSARRPSRVLHELALAHPLHTLREASGSALRATRVWFGHARPRELGPLHLFFGTQELDFGQEDDGFTLDASDLALPLLSGDARLAATMDDLATRVLPVHLPARSYADRVARAIRLPDTSLESAADALHASPRTVQRHLEAEGSSFSEVLDRVRATLARRLLRESDAPLAEVAAQVGFSDVAPFTRAFRRWTGTPPGTFRRAHPPR